MSIFNSLKKYFGGINSDPQDDELLIDSEDNTDNPLDESDNRDTTISLDIDQEENSDNQNMMLIFDRVIAVFNESLPDFLKASIDSEKQKQYLLESLDSSLKDYLKSVEAEASRRGMALYQNERNEHKRRIEDLNQRIVEVEKKRNDLNEQHLSDGRQKRALNERIRDLEKKILELEADREQLDIENKSLVNKIKVANVLETDVEAMREELNNLKANQSHIPNEENVNLIEENRKLSEENKYLHNEIDRLSAEIANREDALKAVKVKDEMGEAMLNDLQKRAAEAIKNLKETESKITQLTEDIALKNAQLDDLKKIVEEKDSRLTEAIERLSEKEAELAESETKLTEAEENLEALSEIAEQIEAFSEIKKRLNERISKLKVEVNALRAENSSLKDTIQQNLLTEAQHNKSYQEEIDRLREGYDNDSSRW